MWGTMSHCRIGATTTGGDWWEIAWPLNGPAFNEVVVKLRDVLAAVPKSASFKMAISNAWNGDLKYFIPSKLINIFFFGVWAVGRGGEWEQTKGVFSCKDGVFALENGKVLLSPDFLPRL